MNRMQLGKDAEVQATRWTRKWAERNGIDLSGINCIRSMDENRQYDFGRIQIAKNCMIMLKMIEKK